MAKFSREDVLKLAKLARLDLSEAEVEQFRLEISGILHYVEQLQNVDLDKVEPSYQVSGLKNVMRSDELKDYKVTSNQLLENAPAMENGHIKVKRIL